MRSQFWLIICFTGGFFSAGAQVSVTGETVLAVASGTKIALDAPVKNNGSILNSGTFYLYSNWTNNGAYVGPGTIQLSGAEQVFNHGKKELASLFVEGGGSKQVTNGLTISDALVFSEGWLDVNDTAAFLVKNTASITGASATAYVRGKMRVSGVGRLYYPIGTADTFAPVELLEVAGSQPVIAFEARNGHPASEAGFGIEAVSQARYWERTIISGEMLSGKIKLPAINETFIGSMQKAAVAAANELGGVYESLGQQATTGTIESGTVTGFDDALLQYYALARELNEGRLADSVALVKLYERTNGDNWLQQQNWLSGAIDDWSGVSVQAERVVGLNLAANNLTGRLPSDLRKLSEAVSLNFSGNELSEGIPESLAQLDKLQTLNLSQNKIHDLPDLSAMSSVQLFDVSSNHLEFDDLEPNITLPNFIYANQARFATEMDSLQPVHQRFVHQLAVPGTANQYQWYRNGLPVTGAASTLHVVDDLNYETMGDYELRVTSTVVPDLVLSSNIQRIRATASLEGATTNRSGIPLADASGALLRVKTGKYDTTAHYTSDPNGNFSIPAVVLGDYMLYASQNPSVYIPTYYKSSIDWAEAEVISLRDNSSGIDISMEGVPVELTPDDGDNEVSGILDEDVADGRVLARQRVKGAGVTMSRQRARGKGTDEDFVYELVAYTQTDENGEFAIVNLPDGIYRLNIQYPGVPMDPDSFVEFEIGGGASVEENKISVNALVTPTGIVVTKVLETAINLAYFKNLIVYPNPAENFITIKYQELVKGKVAAELLTTDGHSLMRLNLDRGRNKEIVWDISNLNNGLYLLRFHDYESGRENVASFRIIVKK